MSQLRRSSAEMFLLIEEWEASEMSQKAFCRLQGLAFHIFQYWLRRYRQEKEGGFQEVKMERIDRPIAKRQLEFEFPSGVILRVDPQDYGEEFKLLIQSLC